MNNGWRSNFFSLYKGLRQGCPSSALLFILVAEVMAFNIRNNEHIHGIQVTINNIVKNIKLTQLADDTTLFLSRDTFGKHSGLILNRNKTEGLWIGKLKSCLDKISGINWSHSPIKALGVYFCCNTVECNKLNWKTKLNDCENIIKHYQNINIIKICLSSTISKSAT